MTNTRSTGFSPNDKEKFVERHNRALSSISHDLKSPMMAIMGFSEILMERMTENSEDPKYTDLLNRITTAGEDMLSMIESILSTVKMEAGKEPMEPEQISDLESELNNVIRTFEMQASVKYKTLLLDIQSPLPQVFWDMRRIRLHVLNNLMSNALKFTPPGGRIVLSAHSDGQSVIIEVTDNGSGIPPEERERIFNRFEQVDLKSARTFQGHGLGLYNARLFTSRHGGKIYAKDPPDGHGVSIVICLPVKAPESIATQRLRQSADAAA